MERFESPWSLEEVIATRQLAQRTARSADMNEELRVTSDLLRELAKSPEQFFSKLVAAILKLSNAESAGVSLLYEEQKRFVWPAVVGGLEAYIGQGTPMDFGPCGTVLEQDTGILFIHPERHFTYLRPITPPLEEVLLHPFHLNGKPVGTIWAVIHEQGKKFDQEDRRLLENLSLFAASAFRVLVKTGTLDSILKILPRQAGD